VVDTACHADRVTIETHEREPREVSVDTHEFPDFGLAYAQHLYKAQGSTVERSQVLIGGWQTDREGAYVAVSRARERTDIHVSREDLGEQGMDVGAIERLGERMRESRHRRRASPGSAKTARPSVGPKSSTGSNGTGTSIEDSGSSSSPGRASLMLKRSPTAVLSFQICPIIGKTC
jgi:hypothetical protein